ncbi:MAG: DUF4190 domain-containing protein [Acidimicrobiales bacterium]
MSNFDSPVGPPYDVNEQWPAPQAGPPPRGGYQGAPGGGWAPDGRQDMPAGQPQGGNGLAVASFVLGTTSVLFSWWGILTLAQVVLAVVFGAVGLSRAKRGAAYRGLAIAGLALGIVGLVIYFFTGLVSFGIGWLI